MSAASNPSLCTNPRTMPLKYALAKNGLQDLPSIPFCFVQDIFGLCRLQHCSKKLFLQQAQWCYLSVVQVQTFQGSTKVVCFIQFRPETCASVFYFCGLLMTNVKNNVFWHEEKYLVPNVGLYRCLLLCELESLDLLDLFTLSQKTGPGAYHHVITVICRR